MRFQRLDATFGTLERRSLSLAPGLNIIESPNESGKSTLSAFLRTMLYGIPTRERGTLADKSRYLPWSGAPMQGTLDLDTEVYGAITLRRDTARANSPMGRFSATYAGTGDEIPGLTGFDCGETLLGVPREVYERSAFVRQSSLSIDPDAELERRIAALITTGEEGRSYSEAAAALKKQLNARRSNARNGQIPALEREIESDEAALTELRRLQAEQSEAETMIAALREQEDALRADLKTHDLADRREQYLARAQAKHDAEHAEREARIIRRMLEDTHVPSRETLEENRGRLYAVDDLTRQAKDAEKSRQDAEASLGEYRRTPKPRALRGLAFLWLVLFIICIALAALSLLSTPLLPPAMRWAIVAAPAFAALFALELRRGGRQQKAYQQQLDALTEALREADAACGVLKAQRERTMEAVYADVPAGDEASARAYVHENLARYDTLAQVEADARSKRQYYETHPAPDLKEVPAFAVKRPERSREALSYELERITERRAEAQSRVDYTAGRLRSVGDAGELETALAQKRERLETAQDEYDAIALAMETLDHANGSLQSRFSPALGKRAAEYFAALTGGKYDAVALDRSFRALTTEAGASVAHDAALLSQGASDQLYLAVRLAICDMVLPEDRHIPLVLDDALINFDDARCKAALDLLLRVAETRQILLLTCQHREAAYLAGRDNVNILTL